MRNKPLIQLYSICALSAFLGGSQMASAHEFWIDPVRFMPKPGASVPIVFRIGANLKGDSYPYVRALDRRFTVTDARGERKIKTLDGDDPAAEVKFAQAGLAIVTHQRAPEEVVFESFAKFEENLVYEGLEPIIEAHQKAGKPLMGIRETYARCAKALIGVGSAEGSDRAVGMPLELVAENNPYAMATNQALPVRLLYRGKPLSGVLVKAFNQADPSQPSLARTDAEGRVSIDVSHRGEYLVSAVHMVEPAVGVKVDWSSYWASLTFARP
jgi:uncharacterized GH25 family protein